MLAFLGVYTQFLRLCLWGRVSEPSLGRYAPAQDFFPSLAVRVRFGVPRVGFSGHCRAVRRDRRRTLRCASNCRASGEGNPFDACRRVSPPRARARLSWSGSLNRLYRYRLLGFDELLQVAACRDAMNKKKYL